MAITASDVRLVVPTDGVEDATITAMITTAGVLVAQCGGVLSLPQATQDEILKYVTGHLLAVGHLRRSGPVTQRSLGDASQSFASSAMKPGKGLNATMWGQLAISLDPTGCLEKIGRTKVTFNTL